MYSKIASHMRTHFEGSNDISCEDVENYLRHQYDEFLSAAEVIEIERLLDVFL